MKNFNASLRMNKNLQLVSVLLLTEMDAPGCAVKNALPVVIIALRTAVATSLSVKPAEIEIS